MKSVPLEQISLADLRSTIQEIQDSEDSHILDLRGLSTGSDAGDRAKRLPFLPCLVLTNVLLTALSDYDIFFRLPQSASLQRQLTRTGLYYAIAQHPKVGLQSWPGSQKAWRAWSTDWKSSDAQFRGRLFSLSDDSPDLEIQKGLATYINPHRGASSFEKNLVYDSIRPWLTRYLRGNERALSRWHRRLVNHVNQAVTELVANIRHHAKLPHNAHSFVQVDVTRGSNSSVHLTVFDTGLGIAHTAQERWPQLRGKAPEDVITDALAGQLPHHGRDRGKGLEEVRSAVDNHLGKITILSQAPPEDEDRVATIVEVSYRNGEYRSHFHYGFSFQGTIVRVRFPLGTSESNESYDSRQIALPVG